MNISKKLPFMLAFCISTLFAAVEQNTQNQLVEAPAKTKIGSSAAASFIYWTPRVDGLTYAQTGRNSLETISNQNISNLLDLPQGKDLSVNWQWEPGFKVDLGWEFRNQWRINLEYTWLYSKAKDSKSTVDGIFPNIDAFPLDIVAVTGEVNRAKASWDLHYQLLHLELGREYHYTSALKFRTCFGATITYQKQNYSMLYVIPPFNISLGSGSSLSSSQQVTFNTSDQQKVFGSGLRLAFYPTWHITSWFGFQGTVGISYLWMYYELMRKDSLGANLAVQGENIGVKAKLANIKTNVRAMKLFFNASLGIFFETPDINDQFRFNLFLGWETHIWINQTLQINLGDQLSRYDLTMQGLTARLRLDF